MKTENKRDTIRLSSILGISINILFLVCYFFLTSQKFEVHSHEGSMSNMVTNTDKQLNIQRKVDPGNLGLQICLARECVEWSVRMKAKYRNLLQDFKLQ